METVKKSRPNRLNKAKKTLIYKLYVIYVGIKGARKFISEAKKKRKSS